MTKEDESETSKLLDVHKAVVERLLLSNQNVQKEHKVPLMETEVTKLEKRLNELKEKRRKLACEVAMANDASIGSSVSSSTATEFPTLRDELEKMRARSKRKRPFEHVFRDGTRTKSIVANTNDNDNDDDDVEQRMLRDSLERLSSDMYALRKRRKAVACHRIAGISVVPCPDDNVLGIRLDICVCGKYAARHFLFFDVVEVVPPNSDDLNTTVQNNNTGANKAGLSEQQQQQQQGGSERRHVRLVQHTLPPEVPLPSILERYMTVGTNEATDNAPLHSSTSNGMMLLEDGKVHARHTDTLRNCVAALYDACYAVAIRHETKRRLEALEQRPTEFSLSELVMNKPINKFSFVLQWYLARPEGPIGIPVTLRVQVNFSNPFSGRPTASTELVDPVLPALDPESEPAQSILKQSVAILQDLPLWVGINQIVSSDWKSKGA